MPDFDSNVWDAGYSAAEQEHKNGLPCSRNFIGNSVDFRNGMTAYRDEHNLPDDDFDMPQK